MFTHDDLDGVGCGIIFKAKFGLDAPVSYCSYSTFNNRIAEYLTNMEAKGKVGSLMVTDASISPQTAALLDAYVARGGQVVLLDHHSNGAPDADGLPYLTWVNAKPWAHVDGSRCGTKLAYDYLQPGVSWSAFTDLVQDYDVSGWISKVPGEKASPSAQAKELNQLRYLIGKETFAARFAADPSVEFNPGERLILDLDKQALENYRVAVERTAMILEPNALGQRFAVAFCDRYTTDIAHMMMEDLKLDGVVLVDVQHRKISLRSREGVNVGQVAARLGGGGHAPAAGMTMESPEIAPIVAVLNSFLFSLVSTVSGLAAELELEKRQSPAAPEEPDL